MKVGDMIRVTTKDRGDTPMFGTVLYEIVEMGLPCKFCKGDDGVKCVMQGGQGPAARKGYPVRDCKKHLAELLDKGTAAMIAPDKQDEARAYYEKQGTGSAGPKAGTGVVEM